MFERRLCSRDPSEYLGMTVLHNPTSGRSLQQAVAVDSFPAPVHNSGLPVMLGGYGPPYSFLIRW